MVINTLRYPAIVVRVIFCLALGQLVVSCGEEPQGGVADSLEVVTQPGMPEVRSLEDTSVMVTGDAIISLPWSDVSESGFLPMIERIRAADVAIVNLETLLHTHKGYPQDVHEGHWMASDPEIANELTWAGIDMVAIANNHAFDYGAIGVLENIESLENAGLQYAGAGKDLQAAQKPTYFTSGTQQIALLSTTTSFPIFGKAGLSRPDHHGRPGLNPLTVTNDYFLQKHLWNKLVWYAGAEYYDVNGANVDTIIDTVREADKHADIVVMSVHSHQGTPVSDHSVPRFLQQFARRSIDNGVDVFFAHGPHYLKGIEIYKGKPIFYSLGNFVVQFQNMDRQPADHYDKYGLGDEATHEDILERRSSWPPERWESVLAEITFLGDKVKRIELVPISLGMDKPAGLRGLPVLASPQQGKAILARLSELSQPFGTEINQLDNIGVIEPESGQ